MMVGAFRHVVSLHAETACSKYRGRLNSLVRIQPSNSAQLCFDLSFDQCHWDAVRSNSFPGVHCPQMFPHPMLLEREVVLELWRGCGALDSLVAYDVDAPPHLMWVVVHQIAALHLLPVVFLCLMVDRLQVGSGSTVQ